MVLSINNASLPQNLLYVRQQVRLTLKSITFATTTYLAYLRIYHISNNNESYIPQNLSYLQQLWFTSKSTTVATTKIQAYPKIYYICNKSDLPQNLSHLQ